MLRKPASSDFADAVRDRVSWRLTITLPRYRDNRPPLNSPDRHQPLRRQCVRCCEHRRSRMQHPCRMERRGCWMNSRYAKQRCVGKLAGSHRGIGGRLRDSTLTRTAGNSILWRSQVCDRHGSVGARTSPTWSWKTSNTVAPGIAPRNCTWLNPGPAPPNSGRGLGRCGPRPILPPIFRFSTPDSQRERSGLSRIGPGPLARHSGDGRWDDPEFSRPGCRPFSGQDPGRRASEGPRRGPRRRSDGVDGRRTDRSGPGGLMTDRTRS
jgi:hypothetical protein